MGAKDKLRYIKKYGETAGEIKYKEVCKSKGRSLKNLIKKYGEEEGKQQYEKMCEKYRYRFTLLWFIEKHGEKLGPIKYKEKNDKCSGSLPTYINRYGPEEGLKKYDEFRNKCVIKNEIKLDPTSGYNNRKFDCTLKYWLEKCDGDVEKAKQKLSERQNTSSLEKFIIKHGELEGTEKYIKTNQLRASTLENYKRLYGEKEGPLQYNKWLKKQKHKNTLNWFIEKYGKEIGLIKYEERNKKCLCSYTGVSEISNKFINELLDSLNKQHIFKKIYYGDNEYMFFIHSDEIKIIKTDLYIKDINLVVEFYGDYWHKNPRFYDNVEDIKKYKKWEFDEKRINLLKEKYGCTVMIVWEYDYAVNKNLILDLTKKIIEIYGNCN